jgi:uncharacterized membrane protein
VICLALLTTIGSLPLLLPAALASETKTIWVAHRRVDCIGVAPQKCYLIKDIQYEDWRFWYGDIEGFDYEEGYAYELLVAEHRLENPPADGASMRLELVEVVLKVEADESTRPLVPASAQTPIEPQPSTLPQPAVEAEIPEPAAAPPPELVEPGPEPQADIETAPLPEPVEPPPPVAPTYPKPSRDSVLRGHLTIGAGVEARSFQLCGAEESLWVEDRTGDDLWGLYRRLAGFPNRPVFMEVTGTVSAAPPSGFGAHFQQQIQVTGVRTASVESAGCFAEPDRFAFRATGNEPFWNVEISRRGLAFSELGGEERLLFPYTPPTFFAEQIIYRSQIRGSVPRSLVIRLEEKTCSDSMADATFGFTASVTIDDRLLVGCARQGQDEP